MDESRGSRMECVPDVPFVEEGGNISTFVVNFLY